MSDAGATESPKTAPTSAIAPEPAARPRPATPRWPAFVPRRGLFVLLLLIYVLLLGGLIAMSIVQHRHPHG